jgi:hypothetical protein
MEEAMDYSNPKRAEDPYALPDVEVFQVPEDYQPEPDIDEQPYEDGWYFWYCFPGCLPDSDPHGPYESEDEALAAAQAEV